MVEKKTASALIFTAPQNEDKGEGRGGTYRRAGQKEYMSHGEGGRKQV